MDAYIGAIARVKRVVYTRAARTGLLSRASETAFYVSNRPITADRAAEAIRAHWRIERLPTTAATAPSARMDHASDAIPAFSPVCAVSLSISSRPVHPPRSTRIATERHSKDS